jgi:hypothetical protein
MSAVHIDVFDQAVGGLLRFSVTRACIPGERYRFSLDPGPYVVVVQGLNDQQTTCYERSEPVTIQGGQTQTFTIIAGPHPNGAAMGCVYP